MTNSDLFVGEVTARVRRPRVAARYFRPRPQSAGAAFLELARPAPTREQRQTVLEPGHDRIAHVLPDLAELAILPVAEGAEQGKLVGVDVAQKINARDPASR